MGSRTGDKGKAAEEEGEEDETVAGRLRGAREEVEEVWIWVRLEQPLVLGLALMERWEMVLIERREVVLIG